MEKILTFRQKIREFYVGYDLYVQPALKFLAMLVIIIIFNRQLGYNAFLCKWPVVTIVALISSLLPWTAMNLIMAIYLLGQLSALSLEVTVLAVVFLFLAVIIQYLFLPGFGLVVLLTPIAYFLHIPYLIPLIVGVIGGTFAFIPVGMGVFAYYFVLCVQKNAEFLTATATDQADILTRFSQILAGIQGNSLLILSVLTFCLTAALVHALRRFSADYSPYIAIVVGAVLNILLLLLGGFMLNATVSYLGLFLGSVVSIALTIGILFMTMAIDYSRTEYLEYEDDDYVYYVKAVPKIVLTRPEVQVKKINPRMGENDPDVEEALEMLNILEEDEQ